MAAKLPESENISSGFLQARKGGGDSMSQQDRYRCCGSPREDRREAGDVRSDCFETLARIEDR